VSWEYGVYQIVSAQSVDLESNADSDSWPNEIKLPYSARSRASTGNIPDDKNVDYRFIIEVQGKPHKSGWFQIIADDCLRELYINNMFYSLEGYTQHQRCDLSRGIIINLSSELVEGTNKIEAFVRDSKGGNYGISLNPLLLPVEQKMHRAISTFFLVGAIWSWILLRLKFSAPVIAMSLVSVAICIVAFYYTSFNYHGPDWWGHIPYIGYVNKYWKIPPAPDGWQYYQQPLYYFIAVIWGRVGAWMGLGFLDAARHFSMLCTLAFILYGLLFIRRAISLKWLACLCSASFMFWPLFLALIGRMSNELMIYPFWAASNYYLLCWYQQRRPTDLALAVGLCGIMLVIKTTALVPLGIAGGVVLYELVHKRVDWRHFLKPVIFIALILVIIGGGFNFGRTLYHKFNDAPELGFIIGNMYIHPGRDSEYSTNDLWKFTTIDFDTLLSKPYLSYGRDESGRLYFWHSYLKSSMFGFDTWPYPRIAIWLSVVLTSLVAYTAWLAIMMRHSGGYGFFVIAIVVAVSAQIINRLINMTVGTQDARMTFPVIIAFLSLVGVLTEKLWKQKRYVLASVEGCLLLSFAILGAYYMLRTAIGM
jgi:hypothetical protein